MLNFSAFTGWLHEQQLSWSAPLVTYYGPHPWLPPVHFSASGNYIPWPFFLKNCYDSMSVSHFSLEGSKTAALSIWNKFIPLPGTPAGIKLADWRFATTLLNSMCWLKQHTCHFIMCILPTWSSITTKLTYANSAFFNILPAHTCHQYL